jgi:hypothetical protein
MNETPTNHGSITQSLYRRVVKHPWLSSWCFTVATKTNLLFLNMECGMFVGLPTLILSQFQKYGHSYLMEGDFGRRERKSPL